MITNFYYDGQIRRYMLQFVSIFHGLKVQTGIGECGVREFISVPTVVGNKDRVVAALMSGNTHNRAFAVPCMAAYMTSLEAAPDRRKAPGFIDQQVHLPVGGIFPDDLTTVKRVMPVPYDMTMELTLYASNTQQLHQILEQLLVLFNPDIQIQTSDGPFDWTKLSLVRLTDISNEENYPSGTDRRLIVWTLQFYIPIWLSVPASVRDDLVRKVIIQIGDLDSMDTLEVDENGDSLPFGRPLARIEIYEGVANGPTPPQPIERDYP